ncbi:MAG TPA: hydantoinase B/oxoprolinase family protein [Verrucomicrobiae bacterium]|nr:hydantoinase B/oxoprolinase family protein [Verrucomicrobiae bacterium]
MTDAPSGLSAIRRQIMWNRLLAVVEEQAQTLLRTAFSPIVRESGDLSAGVFDLQGNMLAQAVTGTPGHVNSMAESVRHFIEAFPTQSMAEGDVYCTNNPWKGTGHLNDLVVTTPAFHHGRLIGLFSCTSHIVDLGGIGFGPDGTDVFMEGLSLPFLKLVDRGRVNETLMAIVKANTRLPVETEGDIYSLINCNEIGARRLGEMMTEFGLATLEDLSGHILESSRAAVLAEIAKLPRGSWRYEMTIDGYDEPLVLAATTTIAEDKVQVDFTGTSPAARFGINSPLAYTTAYSVFGLACAIAPRVPNNAGSLSPYHVGAPAHTIVNALAPAPVASRHLIGQMLPDVVFGCLRQAIPDRVPAEGASCIYLMTFRSRDADAESRFAISVVTNGGTGARPGKDGLSATAYPSGVKGTPVEIVETTTPLLFWRKEFRADSGGAGVHRGGHGLELEIENRSAGSVEILAAFDRMKYPPRGRDGGQAGKAAYLGLKSTGQRLEGKGLQEIPPGERLLLHTAGGGGIGDARKRDASATAADLENALISPGAARGEYGVAAE